MLSKIEIEFIIELGVVFMSSTKKKRVRRKVGDIVRIDLPDGSHAYAQVAPEPVAVFFEGIYRAELPAEEVPNLPVAFRICVSRYSEKHDNWHVVGPGELLPENASEPYFFKQDVFTGRLSIYHSTFASTNYERPATLAECEGLERAAVWDLEHIVSRLIDHAAGVPNKWVESMKIDVGAVPR